MEYKLLTYNFVQDSGQVSLAVYFFFWTTNRAHEPTVKKQPLRAVEVATDATTFYNPAVEMGAWGLFFGFPLYQQRKVVVIRWLALQF